MRFRLEIEEKNFFLINSEVLLKLEMLNIRNVVFFDLLKFF